MLTVIICTYNRAKYIGPLLESLASNTLSKSEYEILLVDNNCTDNTRAVCEQFASTHPDIIFRYVVETEQGLSAAKNCGIREAHGDLIVYVDDDALVFGYGLFQPLHGRVHALHQKRVCHIGQGIMKKMTGFAGIGNAAIGQYLC